MFATVRHRTVNDGQNQGRAVAKTTKLRMFTLIQAASKIWRRLIGRHQMPKLIEGIKYNDSVEVTGTNANCAA